MSTFLVRYLLYQKFLILCLKSLPTNKSDNIGIYSSEGWDSRVILTLLSKFSIYCQVHHPNTKFTSFTFHILHNFHLSKEVRTRTVNVRTISLNNKSFKQGFKLLRYIADRSYCTILKPVQAYEVSYCVLHIVHCLRILRIEF